MSFEILSSFIREGTIGAVVYACDWMLPKCTIAISCQGSELIKILKRKKNVFEILYTASKSTKVPVNSWKHISKNSYLLTRSDSTKWSWVMHPPPPRSRTDLAQKLCYFHHPKVQHVNFFIVSSLDLPTFKEVLSKPIEPAETPGLKGNHEHIPRFF